MSVLVLLLTIVWGCRVSMVVQRVVNAERSLRAKAEALAAEKAEEVERLKGELTVLQVRLPCIVMTRCTPRCAPCTCITVLSGCCQSLSRSQSYVLATVGLSTMSCLEMYGSLL